MQQDDQTPILTDFNEAKSMFERIRRLELQIAELQKFLNLERDRISLLMEIIGVDKAFGG